MAVRVLEGSSNCQIDLRVYNVEGDLHQHPQLDERSLIELLQPIADASHTRDRKRSPPDSACLPGTRRGLIKWIASWVSQGLLIKKKHVLWIYGYAGCGKSAIAQEISERVQSGGRLLSTFFFCRNAGDRSEIGRLPNTLASQMAISLPETASFIKAAVKAEPELLQIESSFSLGARLQRLLYEPFKAAASQASLTKSLISTPYLIIIDGLDECDDKEGVQEFIATTLKFFKHNPSIRLRLLITSRVEQHIHSLLTADDRVYLKDLADHCSRADIENFMGTVFDAKTKADPVIQAHIRQNGSWPSQDDSRKLADHIGGSFIFASTLFRLIFEPPTSERDHSTPLDRFSLALSIDPGLDDLYTQTLARSERLPYFTEIISALALLAEPLPISGIAQLLDIHASAVAHVLVDLQAIVQVPGTDEAPVTFYHTSLRDFLTTESRSGRFFAPPSFHRHLLICCLTCELRRRQQLPQVKLELRKQTAAVRYSLQHGERNHWNCGHTIFTSDDLKILVQLRRKMVEVLPSDEKAAQFTNLAIDLRSLFAQDGFTTTMEQAVLMYRKALNLRLHPHPHRSNSLDNLGMALYSLFEREWSISHLEEATSMHRHSIHSLNTIGVSLTSRPPFRCTVRRSAFVHILTQIAPTP
ncbi:hypothetical protein EST38_g8331 [Candolleomyces aberdarensis]|uniref:Nephrocystin 3-like N-terminal domain-containing protein n=1 Tax=Candolleomyces aberdarensis TaxID=2316362 RepID=A0A4Q2DCR0_9AGAR|nr:hypothetical protein EST38_g8331 [Candolleomyces aberdarensis]